MRSVARQRRKQSAAARAIVEVYRQKRREERRLIRRKNRQQEMREREEIEMFRIRNDAQKFFKKVKRLTKGFKLGASPCINFIYLLIYLFIYLCLIVQQDT